MIRTGIAAIWSPFKQGDRQLSRSPDHREMVGLQFSRAFAGVRNRIDRDRNLGVRGRGLARLATAERGRDHESGGAPHIFFYV